MHMKIHFLCRCAIVAVLLCTSYDLCRGSDHADPQSVLNPFYVQPEPYANITDLHAFIVPRLLGENEQVIEEGEHLIISLCVVRALNPLVPGVPGQEKNLNFKDIKFRVHFDLDPKVVGSSGDQDSTVFKLLESTNPGDVNHDMVRSMQKLYGGIITEPDNITEDASLEFELAATTTGGTTRVAISGTPRTDGFRAKPNVVRSAADLRSGVINIQTGIFDDPFIFPRFFRKNVVGIVTAIPLSAVPLPHGKAPILLWATSHKRGKQIDYVGRSLRTQLPRFGYLNGKMPSEHVKEITRVHEHPTVMENILATFISPLEAHRHYDSVPDVMIYDLRTPARFPNGRALEDDVAKTLADAGETLLLELSYAESKQFPRAEENDKEFRKSTRFLDAANKPEFLFPYLAPPWTKDEMEKAKEPGSMMGSFAVPRAPEAAVIAFPNLKEDTWRKMFGFEMTAIALFTLLVLGLLWPDGSSEVWRVVVLALAVIAVFLLAFPLDVTAIIVPFVLVLGFLWLVRPSQIWIWLTLAIFLAAIAIWLLKLPLEIAAMALLAVLILVLLWLVQPIRFRIALGVLLAVIGILLWMSPPQLKPVALSLVLVLVLLWFVQPSQVWIWITLAIALAIIGIWLLKTHPGELPSEVEKAPLDVTVIMLSVLLFGLVWFFLPLQFRVPLAIVFAVVSIVILRSLLAPNATMPPANMMQPGMKFRLSILGFASVVMVLGWTAFALGVWWAERPRPPEPYPAGPQGLQPGEPTRL
jgi:hypothetical protein